MQPIIHVEGLGKKYYLGLTRSPGIPSLISQWAGSLISRSKPRNAQEIWALSDVSFEVYPGEAVGVIGRNGAGKSTLLKLLARITPPTTGQIELYGRVGSLLEVGTGFHPELTGRENVYLNGAILGMRKAEINKAFDAIVAFAEVERFIDTPIKRYSSGMYLRLAFSVAAHFNPEILLVDEVLAVGDLSFQNRCLGKMQEIRSEGRTVIFVSHNLPSIARLCTRALLIESGNLVKMGSATDVVAEYVRRTTASGGRKVWSKHDAPGNEEVRLQCVAVVRSGNENGNLISVEESFGISVTYQVFSSGIGIRCVLSFYSQGICAFATIEPREMIREDPGIYHCTVTIPSNFLSEEEYTISVSLISSRGIKYRYAMEQGVLALQIYDPMSGCSARGDYAERVGGIVRPLLQWADSYESPPIYRKSHLGT